MAMQHRLHFVEILPARHADHCKESPAQSLRRLRWLIAGLFFLALFLVSVRAIGWIANAVGPFGALGTIVGRADFGDEQHLTIRWEVPGEGREIIGEASICRGDLAGLYVVDS